MALGACADAQEDTVVQEAVEAGTAEALVGENLTVRGQVGEVLSDQAYIINGEYFGFDGAGTLVVGADAVDVTEGDFVEVAGTLTEFVIADIESFYDFDLDDDLLVSYEEQFAVVADSTEVVPAGAGRRDRPRGGGGGRTRWCGRGRSGDGQRRHRRAARAERLHRR